MPVIFPVSITRPPEDVIATINSLLQAEREPPRDPPIADFTELCRLIASNLSVAAAMWGRCFVSDARVPIEVTFDTERPYAGGSSKASVYVAPSQSYPGKTLIMEGAAAQIAGGQPDDPGISMVLPVNTYLTDEIWFDPDAFGGSRQVPDERIDAVTLFLHEMAHGLGFNGRLVQEARPNRRPGEPEEDWVSRFDECVEFDGTNFFFFGPAAVAENGGHKVPLSDHRSRNNTYTHIGNDAGQCPVARSDLMTGYPWKIGHRYCISRLDLAILKDVGLPIANIGLSGTA